MVQIIQEQRKPSFGEKLNAGVGRGLEGGSQLYQQHLGQQQRQKENEYLSQLTGMDFDSIQDPDARKTLLQGFAKKKETDKEKFSSGLDIIGRMREIAGKRNIGRGSQITGFFPGETAKDRAEFAQMGTALIPLVAAGVPIRNQKEFEQYRKVITDPSSPLSEIEGALNALQNIFEGKLEPQGKQEGKKKGKVKFNVKNPEHKAKRDQVLKEFKNDRKKAEEILNREFEL